MKRMRLIAVSIITVLCFFSSAYGYDRVVILAPDACDIFAKLGLSGKIVGVTRHVKGFKDAAKVGSHLKPNIEIILKLKPDLIVVKKRRDLPKEIASLCGVYVYNPNSLNGILYNIKRLGEMFSVQKRASNLIIKLQAKLKSIRPIKHKPRVIFEVMQTPLMAAGTDSTINDMIKKAGGINVIKTKRHFVKISLERVVLSKPDIYIYEIGPMNRKPTPPKKRTLLKNLNMSVVRVSEFKFLRSNTVSFDSALMLNRLFLKWSNNGQ